ncbi:sialic acid-binding Ig-like lectin 5 isoform 2-T2 [Pholidichthys leucotaenia]
MFVLIWATFLFFSVRSSDADTASPKQHCFSGYCVTFREEELTAQAGLCVTIPCTFITPSSFRPTAIVWLKCKPSNQECDDTEMIFNSNNNRYVDPSYKGRVSLLEPDVGQKNCSIIINDLKESDSGLYQLRVNGVLNWQYDRFRFTPKVSISVKGLTQKPTVMIPPLKEGQEASLSCTAPGLCSGSFPEITWMWSGTGEDDYNIRGNITTFKTEDVTAATQSHSSTLTFNASAEHHGTNITCMISFTGGTTTEETLTLNVSYKRELQISGDTTVQRGDALNLTCSIESFPPSVIMWKKYTSDLHNGTYMDLLTDTGSASLLIPNVTSEDSGQYVCTAEHLGTPVTVYANVTVTWFSTIQTGSGCVLQSEVLTCVCISEGFPLPTTTWPLLKNHPEYSVITAVTNYTVNSTVTLAVNIHSNTTVECISSNEDGEAKHMLTVQNGLPTKDPFRNFLRIETLIAFLIGAIFSATICCLATNCKRRKQKSPGNLEETLEMVTSQDDPLVYDGKAVQDNQMKTQEGADDEGAAEKKADAELTNGPTEVEYANIDYSQLKPRGATKKQENTETEYAEVKKKVKEIEINGGAETEMLKSQGEEGVREDEEIQAHVSEEKPEEEEAVYSNVKDIMDGM